LIALVLVWLGAIYVLISGWLPGTYLALILTWALPPIGLQLAYGADILWHYHRLVALTVSPAFLYLSVTDSLAIASGTWTIDPLQTTGLFVATLPIEEAVFFLMTVVLIGFGLTLTLAHLSDQRWRSWVRYWRLPHS
jgi:lycopene cyclase domain-containing protein